MNTLTMISDTLIEWQFIKPGENDLFSSKFELKAPSEPSMADIQLMSRSEPLYLSIYREGALTGTEKFSIDIIGEKGNMERLANPTLVASAVPNSLSGFRNFMPADDFESKWLR